MTQYGYIDREASATQEAFSGLSAEGGGENQLLQVALSSKNYSAARALLDCPEVCRRAENSNLAGIRSYLTFMSGMLFRQGQLFGKDNGAFGMVAKFLLPGKAKEIRDTVNRSYAKIAPAIKQRKIAARMLERERFFNRFMKRHAQTLSSPTLSPKLLLEDEKGVKTPAALSL